MLATALTIVVILFMKFSASKLKDLKIEARFNSLSDAEWRADQLPIPRFGVLQNANYFTNCSLPTIPILVAPKRCEEAITNATYLYGASLFGRT
jgi:hypothetical protein